MPVFTIIAGPNGAGKSTFSALLSNLGALIFDPDLEKLKIEKEFPDISDEAIESAITRKYFTIQLKAIGSATYLTVESNLRNDFLLESMNTFKEAGYETRLVYMLLPDIETSMDRVNLRVKQKGHFVDADSIRMNFEMGKENFLKMAPRFDGVMLISGINDHPEISIAPQLLLTMKNGLTIQKAEIVPEWSQEFVNATINAASRENPYKQKR